MAQFSVVVDWIFDNVGLVIALLGIYGVWIKMGIRLDNVEKCQDEHEGRIDTLEKDNKRIEISLAKIESHLAGLETTMLEVKDRLLDFANKIYK